MEESEEKGDMMRQTGMRQQIFLLLLGIGFLAVGLIGWLYLLASIYAGR
jgi:LPXTG-motif cell wall-anchored protein